MAKSKKTNNTPKQVKRPNLLRSTIVPSAVARSRKDINKWRSALQQAENVENPKRKLLYDLFDELVLDAHYSSEWENRVLTLQGSDFEIQKDGTPNAELTELLKRPWFSQLLKYAIESRTHGHSLIQVEEFEVGNILKINLIPRRHVVPERGIVLKNLSDDNGINYREDAMYSPWLLEIGAPTDLGLLNKMAPHILYKRFAQGAWSEYCELFGMPVRVAKTNTTNTDSLNALDDMMVNMAASSYAIIDKEEELDFVESNKTNGDIYKGLITLCDNQISKLITGAVIGNADSGGSRAKEEVGERTSNKVYHGDRAFIESWVNSTLLPKLIEFGYPFNGCVFAFKKTVDITSLWKMTNEVLTHYEVDEEYIRSTFGIPVTGKKVAPPAGQAQPQNSAGNFFG